MLEINLKAKPFHPCESLLGVELFNMCRRCSLFGTAYYNPKVPNTNIDILVQVKPAIGFVTFMKKMKQDGWLEEGHVLPGMHNFYQYVKHKDEKRLKIYMSPGTWQYDNLMSAQEMCKYLASFEPEKKLDKLMVIEMHKIIVDNCTVSTAEDGGFLGLNPPVQQHPEHMAEDAPVAAGGWAAPHVALNAVAGNAQPQVQGAAGAGILNNAINMFVGGGN